MLIFSLISICLLTFSIIWAVASKRITVNKHFSVVLSLSGLLLLSWLVLQMDSTDTVSLTRGKGDVVLYPPVCDQPAPSYGMGYQTTLTVSPNREYYVIYDPTVSSHGDLIILGRCDGTVVPHIISGVTTLGNGYIHPVAWLSDTHLEVKRSIPNNEPTSDVIDVAARLYPQTTSNPSLTALHFHPVPPLPSLATIPPEIGQLTNLVELSISELQTTTVVPAEIGGLYRLKHLYIGGYEELVIPSEIGELEQLETLSLSGDPLIVPPEIGHLQNLQTFTLRGLEDTPSVLSTFFSLPSPKTTIPSEIGQLTNLVELEIRDILTTTVPAEIGELYHLKHLTIESDYELIIPAEIGQLTQLETLTLVGEPLVIPPEIGHLQNLQTLILHGITNDLPFDSRTLYNDPQKLDHKLRWKEV